MTCLSVRRRRFQTFVFQPWGSFEANDLVAKKAPTLPETSKFTPGNMMAKEDDPASFWGIISHSLLVLGEK